MNLSFFSLAMVSFVGLSLLLAESAFDNGADWFFEIAMGFSSLEFFESLEFAELFVVSLD